MTRFAIVGAVCLLCAGIACAAPQNKPKPHSKGKSKVVTTKSGLKYVDIVVGKGAVPKPGQFVSVHYTGWLTNGKKFDSSRDSGRPYRFRLGMRKVIPGWDEGIATMHVGGKRKLTIPPNLAYGASGFADAIPPNATLLFDVELVGIE